MKYKLLFAVIFGSLIIFGATHAHAQAQGVAVPESISSYDVTLNLEPSGVLHVMEDIVYNFGPAQKHGIYRTIPLSTDAWPTLQISPTSVMNPANSSTYPYSTSESSGNFEIKIGDPNVLVTGIKEYVINYDVTNALRSFPDHDELYWNAIGTEWAVPIMNGAVHVTVPAGTLSGTLPTYCYTGVQGSSVQACSVTPNASGTTIAIVANSPFPPRNGLTVSVSLTKGTVAGAVQKTVGSTVSGYVANGLIPLGIFFLFFISVPALIIFVAIRGSKKRALIPKELKHVPIAPYYSIPDNLPPAQIGYIENRIFDASDFTAIILDLAVRGFLKLTYIPREGFMHPEDYELTSLKPYDQSLPPEYQPTYNLFFANGNTVRVSSIDQYLGASTLSKVGKLVAQDFTDAGYLVRPPGGGVLGILVAALVIIGVVSVFSHSLPVIGIFLALFIVTVFVAKKYAPKFTPKGIELMKKVLGFKMFLTLTEEDRMKLMDAPKTSQETFEAMLPYAIALGIEKEWVKQFASMTIQPPRWISDPRYQAGFNAGMFITSFGSFNTAMRASTTLPGSGSGGGGGVGGGGGGGGGGSW